MVDWRDVDEFPGYLVNDYGEVMNEQRGRLVKPRMNKQGFLMIGLVRENRQYTRSVALLVAHAFLRNPDVESYNSIIHLNGDREDCRPENIMWRPRWFAQRYHKMFDEPALRAKAYIPVLDRTFGSLREFCTEYGLLEKDAYRAMVTGGFCYPGKWKIARG